MIKTTAAILSFTAMLFVSTSVFANGQELFTRIGCVSCHDQKKDKRPQSQGPSVYQIKKAYKGDKNALIAFLKNKPDSKPRLADPEYLYEIMKGQLGRVNVLDDKEFAILVDFLMKGG